MKGVILAAGRGSRMSDLTADRPKCFVSLLGTTLFERQLAALRAGGIAEIAVVTGYRAEAFAAFGVPTFHNPRWAETNMVVSLQAAAAWLRGGETLVSYSDIVYTPETVRRLVDADEELAIAYDPNFLELWRRRFADPAADAESFRIDESGAVVEIGRKLPRLDDVEGQYMGLLKFRPAAWERVEGVLAAMNARERDRLEMTALLARLVARGARVAGVPVAGPWGEVDSAGDLALYEEIFAERETMLGHG